MELKEGTIILNTDDSREQISPIDHIIKDLAAGTLAGYAIVISGHPFEYFFLS